MSSLVEKQGDSVSFLSAENSLNHSFSHLNNRAMNESRNPGPNASYFRL